MSSLSAGNHCQVALWFHILSSFYHKTFDITPFKDSFDEASRNPRPPFFS